MIVKYFFLFNRMNSVMIYTVKRQNSITTSKSEPVNKKKYVPKVIEGFIKGNKKKINKKEKEFVEGQVVSFNIFI